MTATTLTPATTATTTTTTTATTVTRLALAPLRAIRAFGGAAVSVAVLGSYDDEAAGVRDPRPTHVPARRTPTVPAAR